MAGITCTGCGAHITVRGLDTCPICQAPVKPIPDDRTRPLNPKRAHATHSAATSPAVAPNVIIKPPGMGAYEIFGAIVIGAIVVLVGLIAWRVANPSQDKLRDQAISKALVTCQYAIRETAQYGEADLPPYTRNNARAQDDEFYFAWPTGAFEFTNGFGARVKMSASCVGVLSTGKITALTINGKSIL